MTVSLRCFFNSLDGLDQCSHSTYSKTFQHASNSKSQQTHAQPVTSKKLSQKDISFIRDLELFKIMKTQNQMINESSPLFAEKSGSYIEFTVPEFNVNESASVPMSFLDPALLGDLNEKITNYNSDLKLIYDSVDMILQNYGSLPTTFHRNKIRIHFPNSTVIETEKLIAGLYITTGIIYADTSLDITLEDSKLNALVNDDKLQACGLSLTRPPSPLGLLFLPFYRKHLVMIMNLSS